MKKLLKPQKMNKLDRVALFTIYGVDENCSAPGSLYNSCNPKTTGCKK